MSLDIGLHRAHTHQPFEGGLLVRLIVVRLLDVGHALLASLRLDQRLFSKVGLLSAGPLALLLVLFLVLFLLRLIVLRHD